MTDSTVIHDDEWLYKNDCFSGPGVTDKCKSYHEHMAEKEARSVEAIWKFLDKVGFTLDSQVDAALYHASGSDLKQLMDSIKEK